MSEWKNIYSHCRTGLVQSYYFLQYIIFCEFGDRNTKFFVVENWWRVVCTFFYTEMCVGQEKPQFDNLMLVVCLHIFCKLWSVYIFAISFLIKSKCQISFGCYRNKSDFSQFVIRIMDSRFKDLENLKWSSDSAASKGPKRLCKFCTLGNKKY